MNGQSPATTYEGRRVLVVGLGISGIAAARFLLERGASVLASDTRSLDSLSAQARELIRDGVDLAAGEPTRLVDEIDLVIASPGVRLDSPFIDLAMRRDIPVWGELELGARACAGRIVAVTGTKGKSTTSTLIERALRASGHRVSLGGNIGVPFVTVAARSRPDEIIVVEASSFQLATIDTFCPEVAVLLDVTPDHLDWHPDFADYAASKKRLFENQSASHWALVYGGNELTVSMASSTRASVVHFDLDPPERPSTRRSVFRAAGEVVWCDWQSEERVALAGLSGLSLHGEHNVLNFIAACGALHALGVDRESIEASIEGFEGLEHAIEWVERIDGVDFYNDSKATQMIAVIAALKSFEKRRVHLILGGRAKGGDFRDLRDAIRGVETVYALGESVDLIDEALSDIRPVQRGNDLAEIVSLAFARASKGDVVLLSPGGSSFDLFDNYRHRGERFREVVRSLKKHAGGNEPEEGPLGE